MTDINWKETAGEALAFALITYELIALNGTVHSFILGALRWIAS